MCEHISKNIGLWMSDKKSSKLNWKELKKVCFSHGYNLLRLDIDKPLEQQEHIDIFLHKLTDVIAAADEGDVKASTVISGIEQYLSNHPEIIVIDPLDNVRILVNRNVYYSILNAEASFKKNGIFTPAFAEFSTNNIEEKIEIMRRRCVKFPVICKPTIAHGSKMAHEMVVIFNEKGLRVCKPPCVVQNFVNHNAVLHKVYIIGNRYHICERPSLKNFYPSEDLEPIFYSTGEVCKADSQSTLSILDPQDQSQVDIKMSLNENKIKHIIRVLRKELDMLLIGVDVVIDNLTGDHAVIDINVYPGYDNFPNVFENLLQCIDDLVSRRSSLNDNSMDCPELHSSTDFMLNGLINVGEIINNGTVGMNIQN